MPYKVFGDGNQFCVHMLRADGSKGAKVKGGCHDTQAQANTHAAALYANVSDATKTADIDWMDRLLDAYALKVGARHSLADMQLITNIHDAVGLMGAKHRRTRPAGSEPSSNSSFSGTYTEGLEAEGKHIDRDLLKQVQSLHDHAVGLGALCDFRDEPPEGKTMDEKTLSEMAAEHKVPNLRHLAETERACPVLVLLGEVAESKAMADAPGLRTVAARACRNCESFQAIVEGLPKIAAGEPLPDTSMGGYGCTQYGFGDPAMDWFVCDTWKERKLPDSPDVEIIVLAASDLEGGMSALTMLAKELGDEMKLVASPPAGEGEVENADGKVVFADSENKPYRLDTAAQIRSAWSYIGQPKNAGKYSAKDAATIREKVIAAWKKKIDKEGPPTDAAKTAVPPVPDPALSQVPGDQPAAKADPIPEFYQQRVEEIRGAFRAAFPPTAEQPANPAPGWVVDANDSEAIVEADDARWSVPYTKGEDGKWTFGPREQWKRMQLTYEEAKALDWFEVKFIGDDTDHIKFYAVLFGDKDHTDLSKKKDFFNAKTDFWKGRFGLPKPLTYHHGFDAKTAPDPVIGSIYAEGEDEWGVWQKAELRRAQAYETYVAKMMGGVKTNIRQKALKPSSDSIPQYVQRERQDNGANWVKVWPLAATALTPTPAEPRMWAAEELKAAYKSIGVDLSMPELESADPAADRGTADAAAQGAPRGQASAPTAPTAPTTETKADGMPNTAQAGQNTNGTGAEMPEMTIEQLDKWYETKRAAEAKTAADAAAATAAFDAQVKERVDAQVAAIKADLAKQGRPAIFPDGKTRVTVASRYHDMNLGDLAFLTVARIEGKAINRSMGPSETMLKELLDRSYKAIEKGELESKALEDLVDAEGYALKSDEVMHTDLSSYGADWVFTNYSTQLWLKVRGKSRLYGSGFLLEVEIPKGWKSNTYPIESTDITFYNVSEAADNDGTMKFPVATINSSREGTDKKEITVGKLGARVELTGELDEDSIIDAIPEARAKLERQLGPEMDFILFNGDDTAATDNINGAGTPTSGADYTTMKGILRMALKTNALQTVDAGAAVTSGKFRDLYDTMGSDPNYAWDDPTLVKGFASYTAWSKIMGLSDLLTVGNAGNEATIRNGLDADGGCPIHNVKWYPSVGVKSAQASGIRYSATNTQNATYDLYGRGVAVRGDQWKLAWKRRFKYELNRIPRSDVSEVIVTARFGLGYFDTEGAAVLINI